MSPWEQRLMRDREEIAAACSEYDRIIDDELPLVLEHVDRKIILDTQFHLPRGTFVDIVLDFIQSNARCFSVDVGPDAQKQNNARWSLERAACRKLAPIRVRQKRGLVIIERAV